MKKKPGCIKTPLLLALACFLCLLCAVALQTFARRFPLALETLYARQAFPALSAPIAFFSSLLPFSLAELLLYGLLLTGTLFAGAALACVVRRCWRQALLLLLTAAFLASSMYLQFYLEWGLNYSRPSINQALALPVGRRDLESLQQLCALLAEKSNALRASLPEDVSGVADMGSPREMLALAPQAYEKLQQEHPFFAQKVFRPKAVLASELMNYTGITGIFIPYTHESNVNIAQHSLLLGVTACHECAHQIGVAPENEANFIGFLATQCSPDPRMNYSGLMLALINAGNALARQDAAAYRQLREGYSPALLRDLRSYSLFWEQYEGQVQEQASKVNDNYLKSQGQTQGIASYGKMTDLLLDAFAAGWLR